MARQTTAERKRRREEAKAEEFVDTAVEAVKRKRQPRTYEFTGDDIIRVRDHQRQSWRAVAQHFGLKSPGAARAAYSTLTGVPHNQSQPLVQRQAKGTYSGKPADRPDWHDDTDQDVIIDRLQGEWHPPHGSGRDFVPGHWDGSVVTIKRNHFGVQCEEEIIVARVASFSFDNDDHLWVDVVCRQSGGTRSFYVNDISKVQ